MAWMLCGLEFDVCETAVVIAKAAVGAIGGYFLKRMWRAAVEIKNCMITGCSGIASRRGLCLNCYSRAKKLVESGETTWEKLAERGLCEGKGNPFDDAYTRAMEDE